MDFETMVQILAAAQALARLVVAVRQWWQLRKPAETVDRTKTLTPIGRPTAGKEVQR